MSQQKESINSSGVAEPASTAQETYSVFATSYYRVMITTLLGIATITSSLTATVYLPLLPLLSAHFQVSAQAINLTITLYIVIQAIAPLVLSTFSDTIGRRPLYLTTFAIYTVASLGLALNRKSYAGLLVLRALQSLGSSAVLSICYGTISDISTPGERGKVLGAVISAANLGTAIAPSSADGSPKAQAVFGGHFGR